MLKKGDSLSTG